MAALQEKPGVAIAEISVVIPVRNRCDVLVRCLTALAGQQGLGPDSMEVIVVDDGSDDSTGAIVETLASRFPWSLACVRQPARGPAAARNRGLEAARGDLVLFINADTLATPGLVAEHLAFHHCEPEAGWALLGLFTWWPELEITPFMRWAERVWFKYDQLLSGRTEPDFTFFYTCNLSIKREFLLAHGVFDEEFRGPALEDTELGYRLARQGLRLAFRPQALGYHDHPTDLASACRRMETVGRWAALIARKVPPRLVIDHYWPSIVRLPGMRLAVRRLIEPAARRLERRLVCHSLYKLVAMTYYVRGLDQGIPAE